MINDLRCTEQYLAKEQIETWKERNILYNTLWFWLMVKGPDVEYSDAAINEYKKLKCYAEWKVVEKKAGKRVLNAPIGEISADLMTGWWKPFKFFLKLNNKINRKTCTKQFFDDFGSQLENMSNEEVSKWMAKEFGRDESACKKCLEFLKVVYTGGNMIPIITNYKSGSTLDGWDTKMLGLIDDELYNSKQVKSWNKYIQEVFGSVNEFINQNKLQHYLSGEKVDLFWDRTIKFGYLKATDQEWKRYFEKVESKISYRNELLNSIEV
ncbi:MAG: hypothetical protein K2N89_12275 [Lachnospiraceae bacterium]|nr:hypothetical protein [Lachnospiraceae bacterium]